ncbi:GTPase Era [Prevotella sp. kh1p2]|uniref:GTPase Era n=1 Tax=Prevotella sp. kh1p2 TaxID=1761883 RepID=UPI0008BE1349|nr:GTPase Era [Prevotella sp. kh1p2]SET27075.1 GTP-binding protein Era [Prevotella sp. kh1p2]SNU12472.1 GTP-binding protein Era [Prevotellaceae bacterium KH2P17]
MHKAGFVNIVGNPNVGKSTLMNQLVGEKISIATFKAQTTRHRIMGIVNTDDMQIVFSDTPGVLKPNYKMQEMMLAFSESALADADVLLYVTDVVENPEKNLDFLEKVKKMTIPVLLLINKIDETDQHKLGDTVERWHALLPNAEILPISAKNKFGIDMLMKRIKELLPESPAYFDKDQLTDKPAKFFVSEIIREKILRYYDKEIPYSVEVAVERFKEDEHHIHINAVIYVERDSQKGVIIGHQGMALKKVSSEARRSLESFFGKSIYLETFVKVDKDWRNSQRELENFGYSTD